MDAPQEEFYTEPKAESLIVLFRIISRRSWDELHRWHEALPVSRVEHVLYGIYALIIPQGGARELVGLGEVDVSHAASRRHNGGRSRKALPQRFPNRKDGQHDGPPRRA
jgi:hypothetical protein